MTDTRAGTEDRNTGRREEKRLLAAAVFDPVPRAVSTRDFERFQELIYREAGIWLSPMKVSLLAGRLAKRLRHHGLRAYKDYYNLVVESTDERSHMLDAITTNETHFFREPQHFECLKSVIFPKWMQEAADGLRRRRIRAWSAGCSTGQEAYSLAMVLLHHFPPTSGWQIEIIATDLSNRALEIAKRGIWPREKACEIPREYLKEFMLKGVGSQAAKIKAGRDIASVIQFSRVNLNDHGYPFSGPFDLIFCRNVLIYFDKDSRERTVRRLTGLLAEDGYLFVGHAESLTSMKDAVCTVIPTVYKLSGRAKQRCHDGKDDRN